LLCALVAAPTAARAYSYGDTLTTIWRPLPNLPVIVRPGDTFTVWANAASGVSGWSASLQFAALTVPLTPAGGGYQASKGRWELQFTVPAGTPEEMYDLSLTSNGTLPDVASHSVKVIPAFRGSYYFAQISDTHLPEHTFSTSSGINTADTTGMADFDAVINDLNVIHPEFILHTGDLVNEGELEEYLGMYEMGRAQGMISRLFAPMFVISGNHDIGGWDPTPPPPGTSRKDWWRYFGWPFLASPPAGDPYHSQDFSFDYGLFHGIGLESYQNDGSYDDYMTNLWGAQSMTQEQMNWLAGDVSTVPAGHFKLAFFHYDFGGTLPNGLAAANFTQFNNPAGLGLNGVIWGHNHGVADATLAQRNAQPFNLGCQSVIDRRSFRIFRVSDNGTVCAVSPGIIHHSSNTSFTTDSLTTTWSDLNNGTRVKLVASVFNGFGETWEHAQLLFVMVDHDSSYGATGGTVQRTIRQGGRVNVYVDCVLGAGATTVVTVASVAPNNPVGVGGGPGSGLRFDAPVPSPWGSGALTLSYALPVAGPVHLWLADAGGRRVADLFRGDQEAGPHTLRWEGPAAGSESLRSGIYLVRLETAQGTRTRKVAVR
jgi:hypothetical protein